MGLYDDGLASSSPGFLRTGVTNESLKLAENLPVAREQLNKWVRNGESRSVTSLRVMVEGMGE